MFTYFNKLERCYRRQPPQVGVKERAGGVGRVLRRYTVGDPLGCGRPVWCGERESVVSARVQRVHLSYEQIHDCPIDMNETPINLNCYKGK